MIKKDYKYEVKDIDQKGRVTIAISGFNNVDSDMDVIRKGAFTKTFNEGMNRIKHVWQHKIDVILGLPIELKETDTHAVAVSQLNLEKQFVRDVYSDYKFFAENGRSLEHSIGFEIMKTQENKEIEGQDITEVKLWEYSTVSLGANPDTPLLDLKGWDVDSLEKYLRNYDVSDEKGKYVELIIKAVKSLKEPSSDTLKEIFKEPEHTPDAKLENFFSEWTKNLSMRN